MLNRVYRDIDKSEFAFNMNQLGGESTMNKNIETDRCSFRRMFPLFFAALSLLAVFGSATPSGAFITKMGDMPLTIMGYINQGLGYGITGDEHYDTKEGPQSAYYNVLLEMELEVSPNLRFFGSGMLTGDWAYEFLSGDSEWEKKAFVNSRDELAHDTVLRDLLQEAHVTWTPGNFYLRAGKQIVVWGETDGFRIMDQINPLDQRRGITDVEFESTVLPTWLLRAQCFFQPQSTWLQDLGFEFVFNPNADFEKNRDIVPGNDVAGIWAPNVLVPLGPGTDAHLGSLNYDLKEPDTWDSDGFEYGLRVRSVVRDAILTLNYFYGLDNSPITKNAPMMPDIEVSPWDNMLIIHPYVEGYYPLFRFGGATFTKDFPNISSSALGGVAPVLRLEGFYAFSNTFTNDQKNTFETHDEIRWAIGVDWKVKVDWLNPRAYFMISPQFYHRYVVDYPDAGQTLTATASTAVKENNYQTSLMINTTYFHNKLQPSIFWLGDWTYGRSGFIRPQLKYEYSSNWDFTLGAIFLYGDADASGKGFEPLRYKDHVYFTASYRF